MKWIEAFTDGACSGNPGPGGWGAILRWNGNVKELKGGEADTTNNRMELMAAISALSALKEPCEVDLYTDSVYVRDGISGWIEGWKRNGWKTAAKKPDCGRRSTKRANRTRSTGIGSRAMPDIRKMNAPMNLPGRAWSRSNMAAVNH